MTHPSNPKGKARAVSGLAAKIGIAVFCRLVLNTARRFAYPFAPVLSRGLDVPLTAITSIIALNQSTAIIGMLLGPITDKMGYRLMMMIGLGVLAVGMLCSGFFPFYGVVLTGLFFAGLGKIIFDPALQAYIGERVPYNRRGLIIGILEISWAGSSLIGIPLIGLLIQHYGWRAPFFLLGIFSIFGMAAVRMMLMKGSHKSAEPRSVTRLLSSLRWLIKKRPALGALGFSFFVSMANDNLFVVYGVWLEKSYGLGVAALGFSTVAIGIAELFGEGLTAALSDRFGLKRSVFWGLGISILSYGFLPFLGQSLSFALAGLFFVFLSFEFTIVSMLSLCTELLPESRATMMAGFYAAGGIGRIAGALIGGPLWLSGGISVIGMFSAIFTGFGLISLVWGIKDWKTD